MSDNNMATSTTTSEPNNIRLKEALCVQQRLLQKLYNELDVERESAATAASEALSMILRLQGEKAAVKMEAEQYKRLAEEKMNHAEEYMEIFEEYMYQKEMEVASLDYQVQAYRYKLLSLGYDDLGVNEVKFPENLLQRNESLVGETSSDAITKKNTPTPKRLKLPNLKKGPLERDRSIVEDPDVIAKIVEESSRDDENNQNLDMGLKADGSSVDINSYLEQIRDLDKVVEDMVGDQNLFSSPTTSRCSSIPSKLNEMDLAKPSQKSIEDKISLDVCSPSVHDVFEVPQIDETLDSFKDDWKSKKDDEKFRKLTTLLQSPQKSHDKEEIFSKRHLLPKHKDKKEFLPEDGINVDCHLALVHQPTKSAAAADANITDAETEALEQNVRQEPLTTREEHERRLLYEINEKLISLQSEIRSRNKKINKSSPNYDIAMIQLREAMLDFWF